MHGKSQNNPAEWAPIQTTDITANIPSISSQILSQNNAEPIIDASPDINLDVLLSDNIDAPYTANYSETLFDQPIDDPQAQMDVLQYNGEVITGFEIGIETGNTQ